MRIELKKLIRAASAGLIFVAIEAFAPGADAYDWKTIPGTICVPDGPYYWTGTTNPYQWAYVEGSFRILSGSGTRAMSVHCPIVRDIGQGAGLSGIDVRVLDYANNVEVSCTAHSLAYDGTLVQQSTVHSGVAFSSGYKQLPFSLAQYGDWGFYDVQCLIGHGSGTNGTTGIVGFGYAENGGDGF